MRNYEKRIGLKTVYLTFVRHFIEILIIFIPVSIVSLIGIKGFVKPTFSASITITKNGTIFSVTQFETILKIMKSDETYEKVNTVSNISKAQYNDGLSYPTPYSNNNLKGELTFTFKSSNKNTPVQIINTAAEYTKSVINEKQPFDIPISFVPATNYSTSDNSNKYLVIALMIDLVLSLAIPFVFEIVGDRVYDKDDITYLGCSGYELNVSKTSKLG